MDEQEGQTRRLQTKAEESFFNEISFLFGVEFFFITQNRNGWIELIKISPGTWKTVVRTKRVFRIYDILVWIRIRIRGSMPLMEPDSDPDADPAIFVIDL